MTEKIGQHVIYIDTHFVEHNALVVKTWGQSLEQEPRPSINLVYVSSEKGEDQYGAQKMHESSVSHYSYQTVKARCWKLPTE